VRARYNVTGDTVVQILLIPSAQWSSRMIRPSGLHPLTYVSCLGEVPGSIPGWALVFCYNASLFYCRRRSGYFPSSGDLHIASILIP
jgi:hypothetical protein